MLKDGDPVRGALSSHYHLLLRPRDGHQLSAFMSYLNGNLAKVVGRMYGWKEKTWGRRYQGVLVGDEPADQIDRLRYLLAHGVKEGLVARRLATSCMANVRMADFTFLF